MSSQHFMNSRDPVLPPLLHTHSGVDMLVGLRGGGGNNRVYDQRAALWFKGEGVGGIYAMHV